MNFFARGHQATSESKSSLKGVVSSGHNPTVSIGLPVYNGEKYLSEALDSLLRQTHSDFELIISDNASTDRTKDISLDYQSKDRRVRYLRQANNIGAGQNYISVLREARGHFFMWAAHDDIWADNWLEILIRNMSTDDIGIRGKVLLYLDQAIIAEKIPPNYRRRDFFRCFLANETDYRSHYAYSLFSREKLLAVNLMSIDLDYYPDAIFVYSLLHQGALRTVEGTHHIYRLHDRNLGSEYSNRWKGWKKILYRIHPLRYYLYYLNYSEDITTKASIAALIPIKHIYAQASFWYRGFRQIVTRKPFV